MMKLTQKEKNELLHKMDAELEDGSPEKEQLKQFAYECKKLVPKCEFFVRQVCRDADSKTYWYTVVVERKNGTSFQMLSPRDWEEIMMCETFEELNEFARAKVFGRYASLYQ